MTTVVWDADVMITIDADLQDDPDKIPEMIEHYKNGCEIVYGVRSDRQTDFWFKRNTAESFYKLMNQMDVTMIPDSADFRLMSNRAVYALLKYSERNLFLRGLVPQLGFQARKVYYQRMAQLAGETKYPFKKWLVWRSMELRH
ncbi:MAG: glycosyltransferase [Limosilactobacillus mucosae]|jgi:glycosyltransferase involved in cell wall biosynthesis